MGARRVVTMATILVGLTLQGCGGGGGGDHRKPTIFEGIATEIPEVLAEFQTRLGDDNGGVPEQSLVGRREINWDDVPDQNAAPGFLDPDFYNTRTAPFARGIDLRTPGQGVEVSADTNNPTATPVRFGNINGTYVDEFTTFSPERLFSPIGSNILDVTFFVAGHPDVPALTRGFGAIFSDVDFTKVTSIEVLAENDTSLGSFFVEPNDHGLSFLGVLFDNPVIKHVRITYGNEPLGETDGGDVDVVVTDDFIYGEPQPQDD